MEEATKKIEALLFVAGEPVAKTELAALLSTTIQTVETYLEELSHALADHGISLLVTSTHAHLVTAPAVSDYLATFLQEEEAPLSKAALETLTLIAYRGPVSRYDIEAIRGVDSRRVLRQLKYRGFIKNQAAGQQTAVYEVTGEFFQHLGITSKEELPNFAVLSQNERIKELLHQETPTS